MITTLLLRHRIRHVGVYTFCMTMYYMMVALKDPILYHDTMYYHIFYVYINFFMVIGLLIYMCKNLFVINLI